MKKAIVLIICFLAVIYTTVAVLLLDVGNWRTGTAHADGWMIVQYMLTDNDGNFIVDADGNNVFHNKNVPLFVNKETGIAETRERHTRLAGADLFTFPGHDFDSWLIGTERFDPRNRETRYLPGGLVGPYLEIYTLWMPKLYQITFDSMGGSPTPARAWVRHGDQFGHVISSNSHITRPNFNFGGWWTAPTGGTQIWHDTIVDITENTTLFARWIPDGGSGVGQTFAVNFFGNGHTSTLWPMGFQEFAAGTNARLRQNGFVRTGFRFDGWATSPNGGVVFADQSIITNISRSYHLWAVWSPGAPTQQVTISYISFAGGTVIGTQSVTVGQPYGPLGTATRNGYRFDGWFTDNGTQVTANTIVSINRNHNLTARWTHTCVQVTVTYINMPGGSALGTQRVTVGQPYGALATVTRTGFTFQGWFTDAGVRVTTSTIVTATTNHNLTARWA